jgi:predicted enzyme related to lactoylglutathione lyase
MVYFAVDNVDASAAKVTELGGETLTGPADMPGYGRYVVIKDPTGAVVTLFKPEQA